jgi:hypothetical protein
VLVPFPPVETPGGETRGRDTKITKNGQNTCLVVLQPDLFMASLFEQDEERMSSISGQVSERPYLQMISDEITEIFDKLSFYRDEPFSASNVSGQIHSVPVFSEEDYMVAVAYIADCFTFGRQVNMEKFDVERERKRMVDLFI